MTNEPDRQNRGTGDSFDGTADDVVMPDHVRAEAEARIAAAVEKYGEGRGPGS